MFRCVFPFDTTDDIEFKSVDDAVHHVDLICRPCYILNQDDKKVAYTFGNGLWTWVH